MCQGYCTTIKTYSKQNNHDIDPTMYPNLIH